MLWQPKNIETTNWFKFCVFLKEKHKINVNAKDLYAWSIANIEIFWEKLADFLAIKFHNKPSSILDNRSKDMFNRIWFQDASLNIVEQYLNPKYKNNTAIISYDEFGFRTKLSYAQLNSRVNACRELLLNSNIKKNDRVIAIMPNIEATIIAFLATASIGAIWSSCSPDFGEEALLDRFTQINPKILFTVNAYNYHGKTIDIRHKIINIKTNLSSLEKVLMFEYIPLEPNAKPQTNNVYEDLSHNIQPWDINACKEENYIYEAFDFNHPLYIMFSSGTTGRPKCIVHGVGGTILQHLKELMLHTDLSYKDNILFYTTCGWMMWNWTISALGLGASITLYEGSPLFPKKDILFDIIAKEEVSVFGTSARFITELEKNSIEPIRSHDLKCLRTILSTGSALSPTNFEYVYEKISPNVQLSSISGGTDIISCFALGSPIKPVYKGELQTIGLGMAVDIYDENGKSLEYSAGELVCTKPFPSMPIYFWNDADKKIYHKAYFEKFPNVWAHGDNAEKTTHKGLIIHGRSDGILNPGGVRIGSAEIYRPLSKIPEILEAVAIDQKWHNDSRIVLFIKLKEPLSINDTLITKIKSIIKEQASPKHVPKIILQVKDIPKTFNGKIMEAAVRQAIHNEAIPNLHAMSNPQALEDFYNRKELVAND